jgi:NAD(P)-dependent dehydrogenase (short-subunit alcohol dehydrogenase family)
MALHLMNATHGKGILDDKVMLIAGVGPAMGAATALVAAREGAKVALLARRTEISGETADAIRADGGSARAAGRRVDGRASLELASPIRVVPVAATQVRVTDRVADRVTDRGGR